MRRTRQNRLAKTRGRRPFRVFLLVSFASALLLGLGAAAAFGVGFPQKQTGRPSVDARAPAQVTTALAKVPAVRADAAAALGRQLGTQAVVTLDPLTGTPSYVARLDGFLTAASRANPASIALDFVRAHRNVFGLSDAEISALRQAPKYVSIDGTTHLRWMQQYRGVPVFDNELRANVDRNGQLINVLGSPVTNAAVASTSPAINAVGALNRARQDGGAAGHTPAVRSVGAAPQHFTFFADGSQADLVIFHLATGNQLAWHLYAYVDPTHTYEYILNANSGRVLFRNNIVDHSSGTGTAWLYNPSPIFGPTNGLADGHTQLQRNYPDSWGPISHTKLSGNNVHTYSDVNDNNLPGASEEVGPTSFDVEGHPIFNYPFTDFTSSNLFGNCDANFPCSWDFFDNEASWQTNRKQNAAQVFWFVNNFHDHLQASPIGFTPAAGNFQVSNNGQGGKGNDPVLAENDDGANTDGSGGPDQNHVDNANMATVQDGISPRMQMYLFTQSNFVDSNGGDEADVVYHEYTHGLSHRLVTDAQGFPRLDGEQAGAMGEGWSDWYAMDYLVSQNLDTDTATTGDVFLGYYVSDAQHLIRSMSMDCPVGTPANSDCQSQNGTGHQGGYTLANYGQVSGSGPEVHADGEIWGQTLWQIRQAFQTTGGSCAGVCSTKAEQLITRAMELSPPNPSMLDERNAILQADKVDFGGADQNTLWQIFAQRGMGFFAADLGSGDTSPVADFHTPPPPSARTATLTGVIRDADSGRPVNGATVMFADHSDLSAHTNSTGRYAIHNVAPGSYPYLFILARGFDGIAVRTVGVGPGTTTVNRSIRRDWASLAGGGQAVAATPPNLTSFGCGPANAIDQSQGSGWGSYAPTFGGNPGQGLPSAPHGPRTVVIRLPAPVNIRQFAMDPGATCGDDDTASVGPFTLSTSSNGSTFHQVASGTFGHGNDHRMNGVSLSRSGANARYVRLTELGNQGPDGHPQDTAYHLFMDMSELEVYGTPSPPCHVPKLKGKSLSSAKHALTSANCGVGKVTKPRKHKKHRHLVVGRQSIPAGSTRPGGTQVNLKLVYK